MKLKLFLTLTFVAVMLFSFRHKIENLITRKCTLWAFKPSTYCNNESIRCLKYRMFSPKINNSEKYPLVLVLHGGAQKGEDNEIHVFTSSARAWIRSKFQKRYPCFVLAPQCPHGGEWVTIRPKSIPYGHYEQDKFPESEEMKLTISLIRKLISEKPIDANRIYVTGYSMGATGSWDILTRHPDLFAGSLVVSGETDPSKAHLLKKIPIWSFCGELDSIVYPIISENMINAVNSNGGKVKYTLLKGFGHNIEGLVYEREDVKEWLFSQNKNLN